MTLYELIELNNEPAFCRTININDEPIVKSTIAVLHTQSNDFLNLDPENFDRLTLAEKVQTSAICCLAFIYQIGKG